MTENVSRPSRRSVARGAAWALPTLVVAGHAPALAASSPCRPMVIDWDTLSVGTSAVSTTVNGITLTIDRSSNVSYGDLDLTVQPGPQGGVPGKYVLLSKKDPIPGVRASYVFRFSQAVHDISFTIVDIDAAVESQWVDAVALTKSFDISSRGSSLTGAASPTDFVRPTNNATGNIADTDPAGNLAVTHPGALELFQLYYRNDYPSGQAAGTGTRTQGIGITDIRFTPSSC